MTGETTAAASPATAEQRTRSSGAPSPAPETSDTITDPAAAEAYLRPFLGLSDTLPDGSPQMAPVRIDALRALISQPRAELEDARERAEVARFLWARAELSARAYIGAFERLHGHVIGTCDLDAAEAPPPTEAYWADQVERLLEAARQIADGVNPVDTLAAPAPPHLVTVSRLDDGFDPNDAKPFEYIVGNDVVGRVSHVVTHSAACHLFPYGKQCWFDDEWQNGNFSYESIPAGRYSVELGYRDIGDHRGEYSHTESILDYRPIGHAGNGGRS